MIPYLAATAFALVCLLLGLLFQKLRAAAVIAFLPMLFFIAARGLVGVDSANYLRIFEIIRTNGVWDAGVEPGFAVIVDFLAKFLYDPFDILSFLGIAAAIIVMCGGLMLERKTPVLFMALVLPFFMFDMAMNVLRFGLAFGISAIAVAFLLRKRTSVFVAVGLVAVSIQVTSIVLLVGVWALLETRLRTFIAVALAGGTASVLFSDHISGRVTDSTGLVISSAFSGVAPLIMSILLLLALATHPVIWKSSRYQILILFSLVVLSFISSRFFYAGLRVQTLVLFMIYIYGAARIAVLQISLLRSQVSLALILLVAVSGSFLRLRNFSDDAGTGDSPFAPYYYRWEVY